MFLDLIFIIFG